MSGKETTVLDIREMLRHLQQGRSERDISRALDVSRKTVTKYRHWAKQEGLLSGPLPEAAELQERLKASRAAAQAPQLTPSSVEPYREVVVALRDEGVEIQALYQRLWERGYRGTYSSVWRFVRR
jgi:transposase